MVVGVCVCVVGGVESALKEQFVIFLVFLFSFCSYFCHFSFWLSCFPFRFLDCLVSLSFLLSFCVSLFLQSIFVFVYFFGTTYQQQVN